MEYEIIQWIEGKKYPNRLGRAKEDGKGGFYINLDLLPLPVTGKYGTVEVRLQERQHRDGESPVKPAAAPEAKSEGDNDDIPF